MGFDIVYAHQLWTNGTDDGSGGSGPGSKVSETRTVSALLVHFILTHRVSSLLDVPCGGMAWMPETLRLIDRLREVDGIDGSVDARSDCATPASTWSHP